MNKFQSVINLVDSEISVIAWRYHLFNFILLGHIVYLYGVHSDNLAHVYV